MGKWEGKKRSLLFSSLSLPISYQFIEQSRLFARVSAEFKLNVVVWDHHSRETRGNIQETILEMVSRHSEKQTVISFTRECLNAYKWRTNATIKSLKLKVGWFSRKLGRVAPLSIKRQRRKLDSYPYAFTSIWIIIQFLKWFLLLSIAFSFSLD